MSAPFDPQSVPGFLCEVEGEALAAAALASEASGPLLEIGAYCGRSACYLGPAARARGALLYSLDHHRGSEENQPGWPGHDPSLWREEEGALDTLGVFRRTIRSAGLEDVVIALVGRSGAVARTWREPLSFVFIDGGHAMGEAIEDYRAWAPLVARGGVLAVHDVFARAPEGGRSPARIAAWAEASRLFEPVSRTGSLSVLRRV